MSTFEQRWLNYQQRVEHCLYIRLPGVDAPNPHKLHEAMRYACLNGGKRLRAMLTYSTGEMLGADLELLDSPACAMEMLHAYSLIHDDLPAMDDDDLRRGKPTCHKKFDEATAILAGDGLQALSFDLLAGDDNLSAIPMPQRLRMLKTLTHAAGPHGMVGGQAMDLAVVGKTLSQNELEHMHGQKTGALIQAAIIMGALCVETVSESELEILRAYGTALGLTFQVVDDILDETASTQTLGKQSGADSSRGKPTYTAALGIEGAKSAAHKHHAEALAHLSQLRHNTEYNVDMLRQIADFVINRSY